MANKHAKAKNLRARALVSLVAIIVVVAICAYLGLCGFGKGTMINYLKPWGDAISLGLDLRGGVYTVYQAENNGDPDFDTKMESTVSILTSRLTRQGFTEATVALSGENRVTVEIPQITNPEEAVQTLGTTAQLTFIDADGKEWLTGSDIKKATYGYGRPTGNEVTDVHYVQVQFTSEGQKKFAEATGNIAARTDGTNIKSEAKRS